MSGLVADLIGVSLIVLFVSIVLSPLESLGWWAGWLGPDEATEGNNGTSDPPSVESAPKAAGCYVVYLSGIGSISGEELLPSEVALLERLRESLPECRLIHDVFPYAPSGRPLLTGQRVFTRFWRLVRRWRVSGTVLLPLILNVRNLFQVLVSADHRYGPIYSYGLARVIRDRLVAHGYRPGCGLPVVLLGSSGGAQISIGATTYLRDKIGGPVTIVSLGGVMASDRGLGETSRLVSLYGRRDVVYRLARLGFPGRWPMFIGSHWNTACRERRIIERVIGPMRHAGRKGYLDGQARHEGRSHLDITVREVSQTILSMAAARPPATALPATDTVPS